MFGEMQLAEREEPGPNLLQLCPPSKCLDSEAFCMAIVPRGAFSEAAGRGGQVRVALSPPNPQVSAVSQSSGKTAGDGAQDGAACSLWSLKTLFSGKTESADGCLTIIAEWGLRQLYRAARSAARLVAGMSSGRPEHRPTPSGWSG
jgi:hypothetical protein